MGLSLELLLQSPPISLSSSGHHIKHLSPAEHSAASKDPAVFPEHRLPIDALISWFVKAEESGRQQTSDRGMVLLPLLPDDNAERSLSEREWKAQ